jgi:AraC-like DNA-binding protein/ActR/RegA family two-component response regulator
MVLGSAQAVTGAAVHVKEVVMDSMTGRRYLPGVLVVDDEHLVRSFLRDALVTRARVLEAANSEQAIAVLQRYARGALDLLLVDYVLPLGSGLEILELTKRCWSWLPVVVFTGLGSEDVAVKAMRAGASDYLRKPIQLDVLLKTVDALLPPAPRAPGSLKAELDGREPTGAGHPNIQKALVFMREHFANRITLDDVARAACVSRYHFCRLFHQHMGAAFHDYLHELRVTEAKVLLTDQHLTVTEIAYAVGFNDLSHFDHTFRRIVGCAPSEYRRQGHRSSRVARSSGKGPTGHGLLVHHFVFVISNTRPGLYTSLSAEFADDPRVTIVMDRRRLADRRALRDPQAPIPRERRSYQRRILAPTNTMKEFGFACVPVFDFLAWTGTTHRKTCQIA